MSFESLFVQLFHPHVCDNYLTDAAPSKIFGGHYLPPLVGKGLTLATLELELKLSWADNCHMYLFYIHALLFFKGNRFV